MKMTNEHYETLKSAMLAVPVNGAWRQGSLAELRQQYLDEGMTYGRWIYDWKNAAQVEKGKHICHWVCDVLYKYLNDTHILTAIRQIDREVFGEWTKAETRTVNGKQY